MQNRYFFDEFPEFEAKDFYLREIIPNLDAENFLKYINHNEVKKFISKDDLPTNLAKAEAELQYWANLFIYRRSFFWAIADKKTEDIIGTVGFNSYSVSNKRAEISYDLDYQYWGKGIMQKSLQLIIDFAFKKLNIKRIQATVAYNNQRSIRLLEKQDFVREGLLAKYAVLDDESVDYYIYALIKE